MSSQLFYAEERLSVFGLRVSVLGLISSIRLDAKKNIQSVKSAQSLLHVELITCILTLLMGNNKGRKTNTRSQSLCANRIWLPKIYLALKNVWRKYRTLIVTKYYICYLEHSNSKMYMYCKILYYTVWSRNLEILYERELPVFASLVIVKNPINIFILLEDYSVPAISADLWVWTLPLC